MCMFKRAGVASILIMAVSACQKTGEPAAIDSASSAKLASNSPTKQAVPMVKSYDGPFGLVMGIPEKELSTVLGFKNASSISYVYTGKPPKPVDGFEEFLVVALPKTGLCKAGAKSLLTNVNGSGDQIREEVDRLAGLLEMKYGKATSKFTYARDTYKRNPEYWMHGLKEESVAYDYFWEAKKANPPLPNNIDQISLVASASSLNEGAVTLSYQFANFEECSSEIKKMKAANL